MAHITRRGLARRRRNCARARRHAGELRPGQAEAALFLRVPGNRPARRGLQGVRGRDEGRIRSRAVLEQHAVQAGHRAGRAAAREPRTVQSRAGRHLEADPGLVADDLGVPVPRLRSPEEDLRERRRPGVHQDGARSARHRGDPPGLFRRAPGQPEAEQEDQHAGRPRRHQAAHAAGRILAVPRRVARRQSDAGRLRGALHRAAGRRGRRTGQPAGLRPHR